MNKVKTEREVVKGFAQDDLFNHLEWDQLYEEQQKSAKDAWVYKTKEQANRLITENIDLVIKLWNTTKLLSPQDVKYICIHVHNSPDVTERTVCRISVSSLFDAILRLKDLDDKTFVDEFMSDILSMEFHGIPIYYCEQDIYCGVHDNSEDKTAKITIPSLAKEIEVDEDVHFGVYNVPFNALFSYFSKEFFCELSDEKLDREKQKKQKGCPEKDELESEKETDLYDWLRLQGLDAHRQVKTSSATILDIWIPNQLIIELKRNNVTGNDICQAMEYIQSHHLPVVIVGDKLSGAASRGLKAFNGITRGNKIIFVTWDAVKDYLKGRFNK